MKNLTLILTIFLFWGCNSKSNKDNDLIQVKEILYKDNLNNYFSHYEAEHRVSKIVNDVEVGYAWKKKRENNHFFDVAVYNYAAREIFIADYKLYNSKYKDITWQGYCDHINM